VPKVQGMVAESLRQRDREAGRSSSRAAVSPLNQMIFSELLIFVSATSFVFRGERKCLHPLKARYFPL